MGDAKDGQAMKGAGGRFEGQILKSVPKWAWARKVADPPARPPACKCGARYVTVCISCIIRKAVERWKAGMPPGAWRQVLAEIAQGAERDHPARFTPANPWDIEIRWKSERVPDWPKDLRHSPERYHRHEVLLECKSTKEPRLSFDVLTRRRRDGKVDRSQVEALAKAADCGAFAGVLWEVRGAESVVHYIPIGLWLELEATIGRKSLPLAVAAARGLRVAVDPERGQVHTYYRIDELLRALAGVPLAPSQLALI